MSSAAGDVRLRAAHPDDLSFVYATERLAGYASLTAQWTLDEHRSALQRADTRYLIGETSAGIPVAFAILQPVGERHEGTKLKRICVTTPGAGVGGHFLRLLVDGVFRSIDHHRLWLDVFTYNERARRAYRRVGFREDGVLRGAYRLPDGRVADRVIMSVLRSEWTFL